MVYVFRRPSRRYYWRRHGFVQNQVATPVVVTATVSKSLLIGDEVHVGYGAGILDVLKFDVANELWTPVFGFLRSIANGIGLHQTETTLWDRVAVIAETLRIAQASTPGMAYSPAITDFLRLAEALGAGIPRIITEHFGITESAVRAAFGLIILQQLRIAPALTPAGRWHLALADALLLDDNLARFFGATVSSGLGITQTINKQFVANPAVSQVLGLHEALGRVLIFRLTVSQGIGLDDTEILRAIYHKTIAEGFEIAAGYVSPGGGFTTWAVNSRTSAVTEYQNWTFNSFAQMGVRYLAANSTGLYELNGDTDAGSGIIADIKSGMAQVGGSRFSSFKAAYLGLRGEGEFFFKLVSGTGVERTYRINAEYMRSTRVNFGKGLRARYFAFELISTGSDFSLDSIEFVPLIAQRRI